MNSLETVTEQRNSMPVIRANVPVVIRPEISLQDWADQASRQWQEIVPSIVGTGQVLIRAKEKRGYREFGKIFRGHPQAVARPFPLSMHSGQGLMRVARHLTLSNPTHWVRFPPCWRTLVDLTRIKPAAMESDLANGFIHPELTRAEAWELILKWRMPPDSPSTDSSPQKSLSAQRSLAIALFKLQRDQEMLVNWQIQLNVALNAPLTIGADGQIQSGVLWLPPFTHLSAILAKPIPAQPIKLLHRCECGHVHEDPR